MKEYLLKIVGQSADLKTAPTGSKDTGIFFPQELIEFLGPNTNYSFTIYKEDCIRAMSSIISSLPLYSNKNGLINEHSDAYDECVRLFKMINSYFGEEITATYSGFSLSKTTGDRYYLYRLEQRGFSIRKLLIANYSVLIFQMNDIGDVTLRFKTNIARENNQTCVQEQEPTFFDHSQEPLQQIYYGAPGTGKSNTIKELIDDRGEICLRTTFHPDSDYSTFVGCYKPRSNKKNMLEGNGYSLAQLLSRFFDSYDNKYQSAKKARYLYESLVNTMDIRRLGMSADDVSNKLKDQGFQGCAYTTEATCMYNIYDWLKADGYIVENKISYEFTPQAFTLAYVEAWRQHKNNKPVYLVIEEINRGNCAQIFGDLFQLLDRDDDGYSRYDIIPDTDLCEYIAEQGLEITGVTNSKGEDVSSKIARGEIMKLPNNLYIWATMNTSDQSLFPIDSAFKRRWDWKYIKISNAFKKDETTGEYLKDSDGKKIPLGWKIGNLDVEWWQFLQKINNIIASMTSSADKQLGYFFCKAKDGIIDEETFVSKVIFYLWNDVFKDYGFEDASLFQYKDEKGEPQDLTFPDFYDEDGKNVNTVRLNEFIENVMNWKKTEEEHR